MAGTILAAVCIFLAMISHAHMKVCDPLDGGPFLATKPTLVFMLAEATETDLQNAEASGSKKFYSELRLQGNYSAREFNLTRNLAYQFIDPFEYVQVVNEDGKNYFKLVKAIDRDGPTPSADDDISYIPFTLTCTPKDPNVTEKVYDAQMFITDVNDNMPYFTNGNTTINLTVSESTPVGTVLFQIQAVDADANLEYNISYRLLDHSDMFSINNVTGEISLKSALDYEGMSSDNYISLTITAQDGEAGIVHTATTTARVYVTDADDQGPVFVYQGCFSYKNVCAWPVFTSGLTLKKGEPIKVLPVPSTGTEEVTIKAKDMDSGAPNNILFSIASTIPPGHETEFSVGTKKGLGNEFAASIVPLKDMLLDDGFEIFLKAEEESRGMRYEIAMIVFTASRGTSSQGQGSENSSNKTDDGDTSYSKLEVGLIVVVAILAAFLVCAAAALIYACRRNSSRKHTDVSMGEVNNGFTQRL